jgi:hypothetical protein
VSNEFLYGASADVASLKKHASILLGTDSTLTGHWNVWTHLRRARAIGSLDDRELFAAVTSRAVRVWRRGSAALVPGEPADVVVARKKASDRWDAFFAVEPEDILLVVRGGEVVLSDVAVAVSHSARRRSHLRLADREKRVNEDVVALTAALSSAGVTPSVPVSAVHPK